MYSSVCLYEQPHTTNRQPIHCKNSILKMFARHSDDKLDAPPCLVNRGQLPMAWGSNMPPEVMFSQLQDLTLTNNLLTGERTVDICVQLGSSYVCRCCCWHRWSLNVGHLYWVVGTRGTECGREHTECTTLISDFITLSAPVSLCALFAEANL